MRRNRPVSITVAISATPRGAARIAIRNPAGALQIVAKRLHLNAVDLEQTWADLHLNVSLGEDLLMGLEEEARWAIATRLTAKRKPPNYLRLIHLETLRTVKPTAITIIH
jgi:NitT/TauT family transport system substrate-binding protein